VAENDPNLLSGISIIAASSEYNHQNIKEYWVLFYLALLFKNKFFDQFRAILISTNVSRYLVFEKSYSKRL